MKRTLTFIALFLFTLSIPLLSQAPDSLNQRVDSILVDGGEVLPPPIVLRDTSQSKKKRGFIKRWFKDDYPSPKKATLMSLALPGSGQIYNKQYWKLPIVYGAYAWAINNIIVNRSQYISFRDALVARLDDDETTVDTQYEGIYDDASVRRFKNSFQSKMEVGWILMIGVHIFQTADTFVFAHLRSFDVDEDLSIRVDPMIQYTPNSSGNFTLNVSFQFKSPPPPPPILFFGK
ncbi:MAG: DUF5683 domain-containing protein [Bacteroidota bacterium]